MSFMFDGATSFNQPLDSWAVSSLEQFDYMFRNASSFNQSLGAWNLASLVGGVGVFSNSGLSCENRSEEHTSELQSLMRISYAVFCLKKKKNDAPITFLITSSPHPLSV